MKLCVLSSPSSWHFQDLKRAAADEHLVASYQFEDLAATVGVPASDSNESVLKHLEKFDCLYVRAMPAGSLQQVVFRMDVLLELERRDLKIINPPRCIEASVDKYLTLTKLAAAGIRVPPTAVSQSVPRALEQFQQLGRDVVVKPLFGSMGYGLTRVSDESTAAERFERMVADQQVIYQQAFVNHGGSDIRFLVVGQQVFGMQRTNEHHWITNISRGGIGKPYSPACEEISLALRSAKALGATVAGIDVIYDQESGEPMVLEANSSPSWRATGRVLQVDLASVVLRELTADSVQRELKSKFKA